MSENLTEYYVPSASSFSQIQGKLAFQGKNALFTSKEDPETALLCSIIGVISNTTHAGPSGTGINVSNPYILGVRQSLDIKLNCRLPTADLSPCTTVANKDCHEIISKLGNLCKEYQDFLNATEFNNPINASSCTLRFFTETMFDKVELPEDIDQLTLTKFESMAAGQNLWYKPSFVDQTTRGKLGVKIIDKDGNELSEHTVQTGDTVKLKFIVQGYEVKNTRGSPNKAVKGGIRLLLTQIQHIASATNETNKLAPTVPLSSQTKIIIRDLSDDENIATKKKRVRAH